MSKSTRIPRCNYLSLNFNDIRKSASGTKLQVAKNNESTPPISQNLVMPWITSFDQFQMTRDKIGMELLKRCPNDFYLDDPYMYRSRFCIEYHRLHDPGLKRYYNSIPVKNRLKKLQLINDGDDAMCTGKEMIEYLRYLDNIRSQNEFIAMKKKEESRLSKHFNELSEIKKNETQFTGIFRRTKYKREPKSSAYINEQQFLKLQRQIEQKRKVSERAAKIKADFKNQIKHKNLAKDIERVAKKQMVFANEFKRRTKIQELTKKRLEQAGQRKEILKEEKKVSKMMKNYDFFEKCMELGEKTYYKNIELLEEHNRIRDKGMQERQKLVEQIHELNENGMVKIRQQISLRKFKQEQCQVLVDKIMNLVPTGIEEYKPMIEQKDYKEILRRFSMLTPQFVTTCVRLIYGIVQNLELQTSDSEVMTEVANAMTRRVILIPTIGPITCIVVRQRLCQMIFHFITENKDKQLQRMLNEIKSHENENGILSRDNDSSSSSDGDNIHVCFVEPTEIVEELEKSSEENFKKKRARFASKIDKTYNMNDVIQREIRRFFETIIKSKFDIPDDFKMRDFIHLYDFQKYYLFTSIELLKELVEMSQEHDLLIYEQEQSSWPDQKLDLEKISLQSAKMMMSYVRKTNDWTKCIGEITKYICIQSKTEFEVEKQKLESLENDQTENIEKCNSEPLQNSKFTKNKENK